MRPSFRRRAVAARSSWRSVRRSASVIGPRFFAAALLWWRFYTFYIYIVLGAVVAGNTALRAVRKTQDMTEEFEAA